MKNSQEKISFERGFLWNFACEVFDQRWPLPSLQLLTQKLNQAILAKVIYSRTTEMLMILRETVWKLSQIWINNSRMCTSEKFRIGF